MNTEQRAELAETLAVLARRFESAIDEIHSKPFPSSSIPSGIPDPPTSEGPVSDAELERWEHELGFAVPVELTALIDMLRSGAGHSQWVAFGYWLGIHVPFAAQVGVQLMHNLELAGRRGDDVVPQENYVAFGNSDLVAMILDVDGRFPGRVSTLIAADRRFNTIGHSLVDWALWRTALAEKGHLNRFQVDGTTSLVGGPVGNGLTELAQELGVDLAGLIYQ